MARNPAYNEEVAIAIRDFAAMILHGDDAHKQWLTNAAEQFIEEGTTPPPDNAQKVEQKCKHGITIMYNYCWPCAAEEKGEDLV